MAMYSEDAREMIGRNSRSLAALISIRDRHPELNLGSKIASRVDTVSGQFLPENFSAGGTIWANGAQKMQVREVLDCIEEVAGRRFDGAVRRRFEKVLGAI